MIKVEKRKMLKKIADKAIDDNIEVFQRLGEI
jgi:hypothetical protein